MFREAFGKASAKGEGPSGIDFLEAIFAERPDLRDQHAYFPGQGQKAHTVIIGDEVFKGPRRPDGEYRDDFETECKYLQVLEKSGLPVPRVTAVGKDFLFVGMTKVPGVEMPSVFSSGLHQTQQQQLAKDLVNFVVEMAQALPPRDGRFLMHDDLWNANILIDPDTKRLSGVIDFGKVAYKSAAEWAPMYDFQGSAFYTMMQEEFNRRKNELPAPDTQPPAVRTTSHLQK